jgi:nucleoside-diphosphate-sugar epimerase
MQVFLTGATGYIGSAVADALSKSGYAVVGLARSDDQARLLAAKGLGAHRGDLRDSASLAEGARNADAVIHTALAAAADTGQVDRAAVEAILGALSEFNRPCIYNSGCWVVGNTGDKVADEDTPLAPTPLVAWRPANERLVLDAARQGVQGIVLRPAIVYGHAYGRDGSLVAAFAQSAREHGAARMIGDGANRWTFVHLDDLAALYVRALQEAAAGTLLFAAHGAAIRVRDVAEAASRAAGADGKGETVPIEEARKSMGPFADALALDQQISGERAQRMLNWRPQGPPVLEELARGLY